MSRTVAVLRPEPGNGRTIARLTDRGLLTLSLPLFEVTPLPWICPDPDDHDALVITSANAVRHGGPALAALTGLPVWAVGSATADAARQAGFDVVATGTSDAATLIGDAHAAGVRRALHLGGREAMVTAGALLRRTIAVYASNAVDVAPDQIARLERCVCMVHSPRAARRLALLIDSGGYRRDTMIIAALSGAVADAAGSGWAQVEIAANTTDDALVVVAARLAD